MLWRRQARKESDASLRRNCSSGVQLCQTALMSAIGRKPRSVACASDRPASADARSYRAIAGVNGRDVLRRMQVAAYLCQAHHQGVGRPMAMFSTEQLNVPIAMVGKEQHGASVPHVSAYDQCLVQGTYSPQGRSLATVLAAQPTSAIGPEPTSASRPLQGPAVMVSGRRLPSQFWRPAGHFLDMENGARAKFTGIPG
jgi:hypothetical protein